LLCQTVGPLSSQQHAYDALWPITAASRPGRASDCGLQSAMLLNNALFNFCDHNPNPYCWPELTPAILILD
jgi:hypothetical protein